MLVAAVVFLATFSTGARRVHGAAGVVNDQHLGVLASFFPSERDSFVGSTRVMWNRLAQTGTDAGLVAIVEVTQPSIDYKDFVEREQRVGQKVLGTIPCCAAVFARAQSMRTNFGIDGVLLSAYEAQPCPSASLVSSLRTIGLTTIAVDAGANPPACYDGLVDVLLTFRGSLAGYGGGPSRPAWLTATSPKLWHVIYGVGSDQIESTIASSKSAGADFVFATADEGPIDATTVPATDYLDRLRIAVRAPASPDRPNESYPPVISQSIVVPVYGVANPTWDTISAASVTSVPYIVVNTSNGPGVAPANAALAARIGAARGLGRKVLGYIPTGYIPTGGLGGSPPARLTSDIQADAIRWRDLYGVDGFFLDEIQPECQYVATYNQIAADLRAIQPSVFLALNPGRNIGECFITSFDAIVNYEGTSTTYLTWTPSVWTGKYPAKKVWHVLYGGSADDTTTIVRLSRQRNATSVYFTPSPPPTQWEVLHPAAHFDALRAAVDNTRAAAPGAGSATTAPRNSAPGAAPAATAPRGPAPASGGPFAPFDEKVDPPTLTPAPAPRPIMLPARSASNPTATNPTTTDPTATNSPATDPTTTTMADEPVSAPTIEPTAQQVSATTPPGGSKPFGSSLRVADPTTATAAPARGLVTATTPTRRTRPRARLRPGQ